MILLIIIINQIAKSTVQLLKDFQSKQAAFAAIDASGQIIIILDEYQSGFVSDFSFSQQVLTKLPHNAIPTSASG